MSAGEIRTIARRAGIGRGVSVLDLCCGVAGPGRLITGSLGCDYLGVDADAGAVAVARERSRGLRCHFRVCPVPPLPAGRFDVALLLETMLAFADKEALVSAVARALLPGGRFAFTLEEGMPLSAVERASMPASDTVRLCREVALVESLSRHGMTVRWREDWSREHARRADALARAFATDAPSIEAQLGQDALDSLLVSHRLWADWLGTGRARKLAFVAQRDCTECPRRAVSGAAPSSGW
jgi:SAM-dependent methyltransferase